MKTIKLCTNDIRKDVVAAVSTTYIELPKKMTFSFGVEVDDDLLAKIEDDDKLANDIFFGVGKIYNRTKGSIITLVRKAEDSAAGGRDPKKISDGLAKGIEVLFDQSAKAMYAHTVKEIQKWQKVRDDRTKYKVKEVFSFTLGVIGVASGAVAVAGAAATGGASLVLGIIGLTKSLIGLGKQIYNLAIDLDKAEENLKKDLSKVRKEYERHSKTQVAAKEIGKAIITKATALIEPASIGKCEKEMGYYTGKLRGIEVKTSEYGKQLHKLLDMQTRLDRDIISKVQKEARDAKYKSKRLPKLAKQYDQLVKDTAAQIDKLEKLYKRIELHKKKERSYEKAIELLADRKPDWVKYAEIAIAFTDIAMGLSAEGLPAELAEILALVADIESEISGLVLDAA